MPLPRIKALNGQPLVLNERVEVDILCGITKELKCVVDWVVHHWSAHFLTMFVKVHVILCNHRWVNAFDYAYSLMLFMPKLVGCT